MTAPTRLLLKTDIYNNLSVTFKHANLPIGSRDLEFTDIAIGLGNFLDKICTDISTSWVTWQSTVVYAGDTVTGAGLGVWSGTGGGGIFSIPATFIISPNFGQAQVTPALTEFVSAISTGWTTVFNTWSTTYTFSGVAFIGTSTATPLTPGVFTAVGSSTLLAFGSKPTASVIYSTVISSMPSFNLTNSSAGEIVNAISMALANQWTLWATGSTISPTITGVALVGTGTGTGMSTSGVIV